MACIELLIPVISKILLDLLFMCRLKDVASLAAASFLVLFSILFFVTSLFKWERVQKLTLVSIYLIFIKNLFFFYF